MDRVIVTEVMDIIDDVIANKDKALIDYTNEHDEKIENLEVDKNEWDEQAKSVDKELRDILQKAADNIRNYADKQNIYREPEIDNNGINIKDRLIPIDKIGVYVPGGNYCYPSTVLMCAIPAKVAGVKEIIMVTPPKNITPAVLAAAEISGVSRIFRVGGPWSIAALAYGTETVPKVDKIVGPGNKYVQYAKILVSNIVGIDMFSGPSEVVIIADKDQSPEWLAVDLLSQAEHADDARAILISDSQALIDKVIAENKKLLSKEASGFQGNIENIKVDDLNMAVEKSNEIAPEHLQLMCIEENINKIEPKIKNAGAVFVGRNTPVAVGDYWAGPSHALPTGGAARGQEGLNVRSFLKKISFIKCDDKTIKEIGPLIEKFAEEEGMKYHAESIKIRKDAD